LSASISSLIPELRPFARQLLLVAGQAGLQPRITSTYRSVGEQTRLYRRFLAGQNPYPVAPPGHSAHEAGYAFDMMIMDAPGQMESDLADLGQVWESWGGVWGGHFKDPIHFEYPGFSAPPVETPPIAPGETLADKIVNPPWWVSAALPLAATARKNPEIPSVVKGVFCKYFGIC
jgi:hypothetical protein